LQSSSWQLKAQIPGTGKAEFDGQLVDVISDGLAIDRGQSIVVTKTRGNRVLVRAVEV
jgi:membrane-bound ClpP family serine protease